VIAPPGLGARLAAAAEALFAEARQRRRRRRLAGAAACLLLAGSAAAVLTTGWPRHRVPKPGAAAVRPAPGVTLPPVRVAWVDYWGSAAPRQPRDAGPARRGEG